MKGINPSGNPKCGNHEQVKLQAGDPAYIIRRAIILHAALKENCPRLVERGAISTDVINGFLRAERFEHDARSIRAIVGMSQLNSVEHFEASALPPEDLLLLHVSKDFLDYVHKAQIQSPLIERLAEAAHNAWMKQKKQQGYVWGPVRRDTPPKTHPRLLPYAQLNEVGMEDNRKTARFTLAKLKKAGFILVPIGPTQAKARPSRIPTEQLEILMRLEHDIWMRDHLLGGYVYDRKTNDTLRIHKDLLEEVRGQDKALDRKIVLSIPRALQKAGYRLKKSDDPAAPQPPIAPLR